MNGVPPIRQGVVGDAPEIVRLGDYMYSSVGFEVDDGWRANALRQVSERLRTHDVRAWVVDADEAGGLAACALVSTTVRLPHPGLTSDERCYVQWVATDRQFQRRGIATALMRTVMDFAAGRGVEVVELHSSPGGRSLYEELGFTPNPDVEYPLDVRGVPMVWRVPPGSVGAPA